MVSSVFNVRRDVVNLRRDVVNVRGDVVNVRRDVVSFKMFTRERDITCALSGIKLQSPVI